MIRARFFALGDPTTQGNHRVSRAGYTYDAAKGLKPWRASVAGEAFVARQRLAAPLSGPLALEATFYLPRPKRPKQPYPRLDLDKLVRAVGDACKHGGLIVDDGQLTWLDVRKRYAPTGQRCGVDVILRDDKEL